MWTSVIDAQRDYDKRNKWKCENCTFSGNSKANPRCTICNAPRPAETFAGGGGEQAAPALAAQVVQVAHATQAAQQNPDMRRLEWTCTLCTFKQNAGSNSYCAMCNEPRTAETFTGGILVAAPAPAPALAQAVQEAAPALTEAVQQRELTEADYGWMIQLKGVVSEKMKNWYFIRDDVIKSLPRTEYEKAQCHHEHCIVCLCDFVEGEMLRKLPCGHHFHPACIDKWLRDNPTCPVCMHSIDPCDR